MDIITNFAAGEEAVGAIFGSDQDKGKRKEEDPTGSSRGSKRNNNKKKKNQQGKQEAPADDLVAAADCKKPRGPPPVGAFLTKYSRNRVPTIKGPRTTTSRTATCSGGTLKA
jgi:hypothetical protein